MYGIVIFSLGLLLVIAGACTLNNNQLTLGSGDVYGILPYIFAMLLACGMFGVGLRLIITDALKAAKK